MTPGPSSAAEHLGHRNRLVVLEAEITKVEAEGLEVEQRAAVARAERQRATESDRLTRVQLRDAEAALASARTAEAELTRQALTTETRLAAAADILEKVSGDLAETRAQAAEAER